MTLEHTNTLRLDALERFAVAADYQLCMYRPGKLATGDDWSIWSCADILGRGPTLGDAIDAAIARESLMLQMRISPAERFEAVAEQFYRDTGFMVPGKSVPLAVVAELHRVHAHDMEMGGEQYDTDRHAAWATWTANRKAAAASSQTETPE